MSLGGRFGKRSVGLVFLVGEMGGSLHGLEAQGCDDFTKSTSERIRLGDFRESSSKHG